MVEPFIGEVALFGFNFAPTGWASCEGQLLPIAQNAALFSLLGSTFGGDGQTTFALPDLHGQAPAGLTYCIALQGIFPSGYPIEAYYRSAGPWAISSGTYTDASGDTYDLFYPTNLGADGFKHPILTWGNGSFGKTSDVKDVLNQFASWGFVTIASTSGWTGTGNEMLTGAQDMVSLNSDPDSMFYNQLNTDEVGAIGVSQGAGGTVRATLHSGGLIKTAVPISLPAPIWVTESDAFNVAQLSVPVLFLGGSNDLLISPPWTLLEYYSEVPGAAAMLVLNGADHLTIKNSPGGYLGYITAWLMYQLQADQYARGAFVGDPPEANTNTNWSWQVEKNLS